jgi:hypothetical protein
MLELLSGGRFWDPEYQRQLKLYNLAAAERQHSPSSTSTTLLPDTAPTTSTACLVTATEIEYISSGSSSSDAEEEEDWSVSAQCRAELALGFDRQDPHGISVQYRNLTPERRIELHLPPLEIRRRCVRAVLPHGMYCAVSVVLKGRKAKIPTLCFSTEDRALGTWQYSAEEYSLYCDAVRLAVKPTDWAQCPADPVNAAAIRKLELRAARRRGDLPPRAAGPVRPHKSGSKIALKDQDRAVQLDDSVRNRDFLYTPRLNFANIDVAVNLQVLEEARRFRIAEHQLQMRTRAEIEELAATQRARDAADRLHAEELAVADEQEKQRQQQDRRAAWEREELAKLQDPEYARWQSENRMKSYPSVPAPLTDELRLPDLPDQS